MVFSSQSCYWTSEKVIKSACHRAKYRKNGGRSYWFFLLLLVILPRMQMLDEDRITFFVIFSDEEDIEIDIVI